MSGGDDTVRFSLVIEAVSAHAGAAISSRAGTPTSLRNFLPSFFGELVAGFRLMSGGFEPFSASPRAKAGCGAQPIAYSQQSLLSQYTRRNHK